MGAKKSAEEKQATKDAKNLRRREARAAAEPSAPEVGGAVNVQALHPGDEFTHNGESYRLTSHDLVWSHVHADVIGGIGARVIDFGTMVEVTAIAGVEEGIEEEAVAKTPKQDNPAVTGGRFYK